MKKLFQIQSINSKKYDLGLIDRWLRDILYIDKKTQLQNLESPTNNDEIISRIFVLIRTLLQASRIPSFDLPTLIQTKTQNKETTLVLFEIECEPSISIEVYNKTIIFAVNAIERFSQESISNENIQSLFSKIETEIITPLTPLSGNGKSTVKILQQAYQMGIPFIPLGNGVYSLGWGSNSIKVSRSSSEHDSANGAKIAQNKSHTAHLLRLAGLPAPLHSVAMNINQAKTQANNIGWPIVVKPNDGDRGEGVTVGVKNTTELHQAFLKAQKASKSKNVIIEQEVHGTCHRVFVVNQKLLYVAKRLPKSVTGDGKKTVSELINAANKKEKSLPPWLKSEPFPKDNLAASVLAKENLSFDSIPEKGAFVPLRIIESTQWGGSYEEMTKQIHPDNIDIAVRVTKLFGLYTAGIDIITADISQPWHKNGAIINEVNYAPLMGGTEISKSYIEPYLKRIIPNRGRIPITIIIGDDSDFNSSTNSLPMHKGGYITSHKKTFDSDKNELIMTSQSLYQRCTSLLLNTNVESLIMIVNTDEFLYTGLPVNHVDNIIAVSKQLYSWKTNQKLSSSTAYDHLLKLIKSCKQ